MEEKRDRRRGEGVSCLVLNPPDGLDLGSLGVRSKLAVALVLSAVAVAFHDVLVATETGELVAHPTM